MTKSKKVNLNFKRRLTLYYWRFISIIKISIFLAIITLLFTNFFTIQRQKILNTLINLSAKHGFVLKNIIIEGHKNISIEDITAIIEKEKQLAIYSLNLDEIRHDIEDNQWVKMALVERRLPNSLYIAIIEKEPIAIWQFQQKLYLIDSDGAKITSKNINKFPNLLQLVGEDANVYASSLIEDLYQYPELAQKVISAVRYGKRRWDLNLKENINVKMPEKNFAKAYQYLHFLNKQNKLFNQNYKKIDLKNHDKYYFEKINNN